MAPTKSFQTTMQELFQNEIVRVVNGFHNDSIGSSYTKIQVYRGKKWLGLCDNWHTIAEKGTYYWKVKDKKYEDKIIEYFDDRVLI